MRNVVLVIAAALALGACANTPYPLVPDTAEGRASYVCYSSWTSEPEEIRAVADRQCRVVGMEVRGLLGQSWAPFKCGLLTPEVVAFRCGRYGY